MAYKLYTDNNYVVIENTSNGNRIEFSEPKSNVRAFVRDNELKLFLFSSSNFNAEYAFSDLVDSSGSAWASVSALQTWLRQNTGFNTASGGSDATGNTSNSQLISGGYYLVENYDYFVWYDNAVINGTTLTNYTSDTVTLSAADGSNDRFDTIVINSDGTISVEEGTPATNPELPFIDTSTQLAVVTIRVTATSTTQAGVTTTTIYDEDIEWTTTNSANVTTDNTEQTTSGTKSIKFNGAANNNFVTLTGGTSRDGNDFSSIKLDIYLPTTANYRYLLRFTSADDATNVEFTLEDGLYGFSTSTTGSWQTIVIPKEAFPGIAGITYNEFSIINQRNNTTAWFDDINIQEGTQIVATEHPDYTINSNGGNLELLKDGEIHSVVPFSGASEPTTTIITDTATVFDGSQKGLDNIYRFNKTTAQTVEIDPTDYATDDIITFERGELGGSVEITAASGYTHCGVRNSENRFFINDLNSLVFAKKLAIGKMLIAGNLTRGYIGAVTISSYSGVLREGDTNVEITVTGTGFSENMVVSSSANATLVSWTYVSSTEITLELTAVGVEDDTVSITYDNGDVLVDTDAITILAPQFAIVLQTTSTSATFSPNDITKSGSTLHWEVTGDASGSYDANDPTIDLSGNTGTATITVTSADNLAGLTVFKINGQSMFSLDVTQATDIQELGCFNNGITTLDLSTLTNLTDLIAYQNNFTSLDLSNNTALQICQVQLSPNLASINVTGLTALTQLYVNSCNLTTIDLSGLTALDNVRVFANHLTVSAVNNVIIDMDNNGVIAGTRALNYSSQTPAANPTVTESVANDVLDAYNSLVSKGWTITGNAPA